MLYRVGLEIGFFIFGLHRKIPKIPKSRGSELGFENPEKNPQWKIPKIPRSRGSGFIFRDIPNGGAQEVKDPTSRGPRHQKKQFYIPGIRVFSRFFTFGIGIFFMGCDIPPKNHICLLYNKIWTQQKVEFLRNFN